MDWDTFTFTYRLDMTGLFQDLVSIEAYKLSAQNLVLPPDWREQLDQLNRVRAVHGTTAFEGNQLTEAEVSRQIAIIEQSSDAGQPSATRDQQQVRNAGLAQQWVQKRFTPGSSPLSAGDVLSMHAMMTTSSDEVHNVPGKFRDFPVVVGSPDLGGVHRGAPHERIHRLIDEYIAFMNSRETNGLHPVIRGLLAHYFLVNIQPFGDGNGRVSRLVEAGILFQGGYNIFGFYGLSNYFYKHEAEYKTTLQTCRRTRPFDVTEFITFGVRGFLEELEGINSFVKTRLNRVIYRAMLGRAFNTRLGERRRVLNQREYNLLDYLIAETEPVDPFSEHPSRMVGLSELLASPYIREAYKGVTRRTFQRELMRLADMNFIRIVTISDDSREPLVELDFDAIGKY
ncbi:MAG: Fic family protein [bacterium]|nr:Fic family protein [bacterium]